MDHKYFSELIVLAVYDELEEERRNELTLHLQQCAECRKEFSELKQLKKLTTEFINQDVNENFLSEARMELQGSIRRQKHNRKFFNYLFDYLFTPSPAALRISWGTACFAVLLCLGYVFFTRPVQVTTRGSSSAAHSDLPGQIVNLKFVNSNFDNGTVEVTYQSVIPVNLRGNINDPEIQKVLAQSLIDNQNPGTRLKAVSAVLSEKTTSTTGSMRSALIKAARYDNNPGVRKTAIKALNRLRFDTDIRDALIYILMSDTDAGLRILAITSLDENNKIEKLNDGQTIEALKTKMRQDENSFIKLRAQSILNKIQS